MFVRIIPESPLKELSKAANHISLPPLVPDFLGFSLDTPKQRATFWIWIRLGQSESSASREPSDASQR